jgi:hypothetical protein
MNLIYAIRFRNLRNEAFYQYFLWYRQLYNKFVDVLSLVSDDIPTFDEFLTLLALLVDASRKSPVTEKLDEADQRIDRAITGLRAAIFSYLHHYDPAKVVAAKAIDARLHDFGDIRDKPYANESTAVQILVHDLQITFKDEIAFLDIIGWVSELDAAEQVFTALFDQRNTELADRVKGDIPKIRHQMESLYRNMNDRIEADVISNGDAKCGEFIKQLNEQVLHYNEQNNPKARKSIEHIVVVPIPVQTYTEEPIIVIPEVHFVEEGKPAKKLVFSVDFTVTYRDNTKAGTAELIIHGKGAYKGQKVITFNIQEQINN